MSTKMRKLEKTIRYNLVLPVPVYREVQAIARKRGSTVAAVFRQFIKHGIDGVRKSGVYPPGSIEAIFEREFPELANFNR